MKLTGCDCKSMELDCLLLQICWAGVVLVRRLTEWWRFHFWFQPRDALNSGSSLNSFAFRRTIDPLTAIPMQNQANSYAWCETKWEGTIEWLKIWHVLNLFWHLWKLANENLSYTMLSHDTTIVLRVTHSTHIHSAISWLIYFVILFLLINARQKTYLGFSAL